MNHKDFFDKRITLKHFFRTIACWQELYWSYEEDKKKAGITCNEIENINRSQRNIAEDIARFILDKNMKVEILNNELLGE